MVSIPTAYSGESRFVLCLKTSYLDWVIV